MIDTYTSKPMAMLTPGHPTSVLDKISEIKKNCQPLGITVKLVRQKSRYYIKLSDTNTKWMENWGGFHVMAKTQINPYFAQSSITSCTTVSATFYIGTLFDFLKGNNDTTI